MSSADSSSNRPVVFFGSATEGLKIAEKLTMALSEVATCRLWKHGVFGLSQGTLESLIATTRGADFAVLLVTADDLATKKGKRTHVPRDNIVFEIGLFMGSIGRERTFIVCTKDSLAGLPSDLAGITAAPLSPRSPKEIEQVSRLLKDEINRQGRRDAHPPSTGPMRDLMGRWKCTWEVGERRDKDYHTIEDQIHVKRVIDEQIFADGLNPKFGDYELIGRITPGGILTFYYQGDEKRHFSGGILILKLAINSREEMTGFWYEFDADRQIYGGKVALTKTGGGD